jgi:hypothetical protein
MTWRVDQIEDILLSVSGIIGKRNGLTLDGDPPLSLDVHVVQDLILEVSLINQTRILNEAVCKGRFSVVNVCDDAKITYILHGFVLKSGLFLQLVLKDLRASVSGLWSLRRKYQPIKRMTSNQSNFSFKFIETSQN